MRFTTPATIFITLSTANMVSWLLGSAKERISAPTLSYLNSCFTIMYNCKCDNWAWKVNIEAVSSFTIASWLKTGATELYPSRL